MNRSSPSFVVQFQSLEGVDGGKFLKDFKLDSPSTCWSLAGTWPGKGENWFNAAPISNAATSTVDLL